MALLKFRAVVVLPLPFKWSSGPSKGEGGGSRSNTATYRFKDERSSPSNICLNVLKMRVAVGAALLKMREVVLLKVILEALGEGCGSRSNTPTCRFQDERSSPLICLKMRDESGSPSNSRRGSGSMRGSAQFDM